MTFDPRRSSSTAVVRRAEVEELEHPPDPAADPHVMTVPVQPDLVHLGDRTAAIPGGGAMTPEREVPAELATAVLTRDHDR